MVEYINNCKFLVNFLEENSNFKKQEINEDDAEYLVNGILGDSLGELTDDVIDNITGLSLSEATGYIAAVARFADKSDGDDDGNIGTPVFNDDFAEKLESEATKLKNNDNTNTDLKNIFDTIYQELGGVPSDSTANKTDNEKIKDTAEIAEKTTLRNQLQEYYDLPDGELLDDLTELAFALTKKQQADIDYNNLDNPSTADKLERASLSLEIGTLTGVLQEKHGEEGQPYIERIYSAFGKTAPELELEPELTDEQARQKASEVKEASTEASSFGPSKLNSDLTRLRLSAELTYLSDIDNPTPAEDQRIAELKEMIAEATEQREQQLL